MRDIISHVRFYLIAQKNVIAVNNERGLLRLNVGHLYNKSIGTSHEVPVDIDSIQIEDLQINNLESTVRTSRISEGLLLQIKIKADVLTTCTRCLDAFYFPVYSEFEELYQFPSRQREEMDLLLPYDGLIDLAPLYREYLILAMPISRLCTEECQGLCLVCGANLNRAPCQHQSQSDFQSQLLEKG